MQLSSYLEEDSIIVGPWKMSELGDHETCEIATTDSLGEVRSIIVTALPSDSIQERMTEIVWAMQELQEWFDSPCYEC